MYHHLSCVIIFTQCLSLNNPPLPTTPILQFYVTSITSNRIPLFELQPRPWPLHSHSYNSILKELPSSSASPMLLGRRRRKLPHQTPRLMARPRLSRQARIKHLRRQLHLQILAQLLLHHLRKGAKARSRRRRRRVRRRVPRQREARRRRKEGRLHRLRLQRTQESLSRR